MKPAVASSAACSLVSLHSYESWQTRGSFLAHFDTEPLTAETLSLSVNFACINAPTPIQKKKTFLAALGYFFNEADEYHLFNLFMSR